MIIKCVYNNFSTDESDVASTKIGLIHLEAMFYILIYTLTLSTIVLVIEICYEDIHSKQYATNYFPNDKQKRFNILYSISISTLVSTYSINLTLEVKQKIAKPVYQNRKQSSVFFLEFVAH